MQACEGDTCHLGDDMGYHSVADVLALLKKTEWLVSGFVPAWGSAKVP